jgi:HEAT repeat protein
MLFVLIAAVAGGGHYFYNEDAELLRHVTEQDQFAVPAAYVYAHKGVPKGAIEPLQKGLEKGSDAIRVAYARTLGFAHDPEVNTVHLGYAAVKDPNYEVRVSATTALGENGNVRIAKYMEHLIEDDDDRVKIAAVHTVGKLELDRFMPYLIGYLEHHNADLQRACKEELDAFIGDGRSFGFRSQEWMKWYEGKYD